MDLTYILEHYWPVGILLAWFGYKALRSWRVRAMLPDLKAAGATLVDVRSAGEFASAHASGTINIPLNEIGSRLAEIPRDAPVVLCCESGMRSGLAGLMLKKHGYARVYNIGAWNQFPQP